MVGPTLDTLPVLVIDLICSYLACNDVKNFRLTCKTLAQLTILKGAFTKLVSHQSTTLMPENLERLCVLSEHERLRLGVTQLTVKVVVYDPPVDPDLSEPCAMEDDSIDMADDCEVQFSNWDTNPARVEHLAAQKGKGAAADLDILILAYVFGRLPRLSEVALDLDYMADPDPPRRVGRHRIIRPKRVVDQPHVQEQLGRTLRVVLQAMIHSGVRLKNFQLYSGGVASLDLRTLQDYMSLFPASQLEPVFHGVTSLSMLLVGETDPDVVPPSLRAAAQWPGRMAGFCAASLKELVLEVGFGDPGLQVLRWQPHVFAPLSVPEFPVLRTCNLWGLIVAGRDLLAFLRHAPALEALDMLSVTIVVTGRWGDDHTTGTNADSEGDDDVGTAGPEGVKCMRSMLGMLVGPSRRLRRLWRLCLSEVYADGYYFGFEDGGPWSSHCVLEGTSLDLPINTPGGLHWGALDANGAYM